MFGKPGDQLRLFAPASEIVQSLYRGDMGSLEGEFYTSHGNQPTAKEHRDTMISMMNAKKTEAEQPRGSGLGSGVYDAIADEGFKGHIQVDVSKNRPMLWEGHHRLGAAHDLGEQFVGLDYVTPSVEGTPDHFRNTNRLKYEERYPQNPNWPSNFNWP